MNITPGIEAVARWIHVAEDDHTLPTWGELKGGIEHRGILNKRHKQAAIAAFQALHSNAACNGWGYEQIAISSLKYAEALDAERTKRDEGE